MGWALNTSQHSGISLNVAPEIGEPQHCSLSKRYARMFLRDLQDVSSLGQSRCRAAVSLEAPSDTSLAMVGHAPILSGPRVADWGTSQQVEVPPFLKGRLPLGSDATSQGTLEGRLPVKNDNPRPTRAECVALTSSTIFVLRRWTTSRVPSSTVRANHLTERPNIMLQNPCTAPDNARRLGLQ